MDGVHQLLKLPLISYVMDNTKTIINQVSVAFVLNFRPKLSARLLVVLFFFTPFSIVRQVVWFCEYIDLSKKIQNFIPKLISRVYDLTYTAVDNEMRWDDEKFAKKKKRHLYNKYSKKKKLNPVRIPLSVCTQVSQGQNEISVQSGEGRFGTGTKITVFLARL